MLGSKITTAEAIAIGRSAGLVRLFKSQRSARRSADESGPIAKLCVVHRGKSGNRTKLKSSETDKGEDLGFGRRISQQMIR